MKRVPIDAIRLNGEERFRKNLRDLGSLKRSMAEVGLLHPIVVDSSRQLIAGERRLIAARESGDGRCRPRRLNGDNRSGASG